LNKSYENSSDTPLKRGTDICVYRELFHEKQTTNQKYIFKLFIKKIKIIFLRKVDTSPIPASGAHG
jgi:hypothetical protein